MPLERKVQGRTLDAVTGGEMTKCMKVIINGYMETIQIPDGIQSIRSIDLNGNEVRLGLGVSPSYPNKMFIQFPSGGTAMLTANEAFAVAYFSAVPEYKLTATRVTQGGITNSALLAMAANGPQRPGTVRPAQPSTTSEKADSTEPPPLAA